MNVKPETCNEMTKTNKAATSASAIKDWPRHQLEDRNDQTGLFLILHFYFFSFFLLHQLVK